MISGGINDKCFAKTVDLIVSVSSVSADLVAGPAVVTCLSELMSFSFVSS